MKFENYEYHEFQLIEYCMRDVLLKNRAQNVLAKLINFLKTQN